jgi:protein involved in polysaccharide export with SLBB domain
MILFLGMPVLGHAESASQVQNQSGERNAEPPRLIYSPEPGDSTTPTYDQYMRSPYTPQGTNTPQPSAFEPTALRPHPSDPALPREISPYQDYSPYQEVVGEGADYTLGIDDVVTIIVRNQPEFSGRFVVDPFGNIQYNFVGDIPAAGKTKAEVKADLLQRLEHFVRYPEVSVMISEYRSKAVYVFGFVNAPGKYIMKGDRITVKEAIVASGLPRLDAALAKIYIIRPSQFTSDGKPQRKAVNLKKLLHKGESVEDFILQPGDTLLINQRFFDKFLNTFSRIVSPIFQSAALYRLVT